MEEGQIDESNKAECPKWGYRSGRREAKEQYWSHTAVGATTWRSQVVMETGPLLGGWSDPGQGLSGPGPIQGSAVRSGSAIQLFKSVFQNGSKSKKKI